MVSGSDVIDMMKNYQHACVAPAKVLIIQPDGQRIEVPVDNVLYENGQLKIMGFSKEMVNDNFTRA